jgi:uncharacterized membrane protein YhiD involved in acid resistance
MLDYSSLNMTSTNPGLIAIIYALTLTFILGSGMSLLYVRTFKGLSFSRNFVHSLVLAPVVVSIVMQAIGNNLAVGIGMAGTISMMRFRSNIKDTRDMFFLFAAMGIGVACGVQAYLTAVVGAVGFSLVILILHYSPMAQVSRYDGLLKLNLDNDKKVQNQMHDLVNKHCQEATLISIRELAQGDRLDYAFQIKLKSNSRHDIFVRELKEIENVKGLTLMLQTASTEV